MKRIKANYQTLHVLKHARPKLPKVIIPFCDKDLVNYVSECVLNVLNGNIALTVCEKRKLIKHKLALRKLVDKQLPITGKKRLVLLREGFILLLLQQSCHTCLYLCSQVTLVMLHKIYLVPVEDYRPSPANRPLPRQRPFSRRRRPTKQHPHTEWIKLRTKHLKAELCRIARTKEIADYMKRIMSAAINPQSPTANILLSKPKEKNIDAECRRMLR